MTPPTLTLSRKDFTHSGSGTLAIVSLAMVRSHFAEKCVERVLYARGRILPGEVIGREQGDAICGEDEVVDIIFARAS